jgi:phosphoribosylaminoimidazole-succinocarboxamide synthase
VHLHSQLDILLVDSPRGDSRIPALLMLQLEHSGIDYRVARVSGPLSKEIERYLQRFRHGVTVIVADAAHLSAACLTTLAQDGYHLINLSAPNQEAGGLGQAPVESRLSSTASNIMTDALYASSIQSLPLIHKGKVRDIYAVDDQRMLIITTDRLSAFDVILPTPIPGKGKVLTAVADFWFRKLAHILPNQLTGDTPEDVVSAEEQKQVAGRAIVVKRLKALPVEAIVRGYLVGSGWADYKKTGQVCGHVLPDGMQLADRLPEPIFTPSTKAAVGAHDENIDFAQCTALLGPDLAAQVRDAAITLYKTAAEYALSRGIIIADTKFEFGLDENGTLTLIDEVLTPDSSRFWPLDQYQAGINPPSFDKQYVRDWLTASGWNKQAPGPELPAEVISKTAEKYAEALRRLTA